MATPDQIREAVEYAKQNPTSTFARNLRAKIESGDEQIIKDMETAGFSGVRKVAPTPSNSPYASAPSSVEGTSVGQKVKGFAGEVTGLNLFGNIGKAKEANKQSESLTQQFVDSNKLVDEASKLPRGDARRTQLLNQARSIQQGLSQKADANLAAIPTTKQVLGQAATLALNVATLGAGTSLTTGGRAALAATKAAKAAQVTSKAARLGSFVGKNAALGAAFGVTQSMQEDKDFGDILKDAVKGGIFGIATAGLLKGAGKAISKVTSGFSNKWMANAFQITKGNLKKNPTIAKDFVEAGFKGSLDDMVVQAEAKIAQQEASLQSVLQGVDTKIPTSKLVKRLEVFADDIVNAPGERDAQNIVKTIIVDLKKQGSQISAPKANEVKRQLYKVLNTAYGKEASVKKELQKATARFLKEEIENAAETSMPGVGKNLVGGLNQDLRVSGKAVQLGKDALAGQAARRTLGLGDIGVGSGAGIMGAIAGGPVGALAAIPVVIAKKIAQSPAFLSRGSITLNEAKRLLSGLPATEARKILTQLIQAGVVNLSVGTKTTNSPLK